MLPRSEAAHLATDWCGNGCGLDTCPTPMWDMGQACGTPLSHTTAGHRTLLLDISAGEPAPDSDKSGKTSHAS